MSNQTKPGPTRPKRGNPRQSGHPKTAKFCYRPVASSRPAQAVNPPTTEPSGAIQSQIDNPEEKYPPDSVPKENEQLRGAVQNRGSRGAKRRKLIQEAKNEARTQLLASRDAERERLNEEKQAAMDAREEKAKREMRMVRDSQEYAIRPTTIVTATTLYVIFLRLRATMPDFSWSSLVANRGFCFSSIFIFYFRDSEIVLRFLPIAAFLTLFLYLCIWLVKFATTSKITIEGRGRLDLSGMSGGTFVFYGRKNEQPEKLEFEELIEKYEEPTIFVPSNNSIQRLWSKFSVSHISWKCIATCTIKAERSLRGPHHNSSKMHDVPQTISLVEIDNGSMKHLVLACNDRVSQALLTNAYKTEEEFVKSIKSQQRVNAYYNIPMAVTQALDDVTVAQLEFRAMAIRRESLELDPIGLDF